MTKEKHTPGPWNVDKDMIRAVNPITSIACICDVAWPLGNRQEWHEANANLIATAPDLLDALEVARDFIQQGIELGFISTECAGAELNMDSIDEMLDKFEEAIQKARRQEDE